ncbi:MAG: hypothetical protein QOK11_388 [Pseudonocardiales bacterium]|nr:hypothetical protein [Pseudonocardiales bacterium]
MTVTRGRRRDQRCAIREADDWVAAAHLWRSNPKSMVLPKSGERAATDRPGLSSFPACSQLSLRASQQPPSWQLDPKEIADANSETD